jgi:hypothetical protein
LEAQRAPKAKSEIQRRNESKMFEVGKIWSLDEALWSSPALWAKGFQQSLFWGGKGEAWRKKSAAPKLWQRRDASMVGGLDHEPVEGTGSFVASVWCKDM